MFSLSLALGLLKIQLEIQLDDSLYSWSKYSFSIRLVTYFQFYFAMSNQ